MCKSENTDKALSISSEYALLLLNLAYHCGCVCVVPSIPRRARSRGEVWILTLQCLDGITTARVINEFVVIFIIYSVFNFFVP